MNQYTQTLTFPGSSAAVRNFLMTALAAGSLLSFSSCSDDAKPLPELKPQTYTSTSLALTYDGEAMPGKSAKVEFLSSASSVTSAEITLYSEFDLSQLSGMGLTGSVAGPGVLPGSQSLTLTVALQPADGCYTFSGQGSTEYLDYKYAGTLRSDLLEINFTDCSLKSQIYADKVFVPSPIEKNGLISYSSLPFHLVWELDPAAGVEIPLSDILKGIVTAPVIPVYNNTAYTSVALMFESAVKTIALNPDGNIPVVYMSSVGGAAHLATSCGNMLQYVPAEGGIRLYVNPLSALSQVLVALSKPSADAEFVTKAGKSSGMTEVDPKFLTAIVKALVAAVEPGLSQGVYLCVTPVADGAEIYFDTRTSVAFLGALMQNLLSEPEVAAAIQSYLAGLDLPEISPEELAGLLQQLPSFLEKTTKLEIGLSLKNYKAS